MQFSVHVKYTVVQPSSDYNVLPYLWMTPCFHLMEPVDQNRVVFVLW